jgi:ubiquitin carboxyl-terminal hydrolase 34
LGEQEEKVIANKPFFIKAIKEGFEADAVGKLMAHWSYNNEEYSAIFASVLLHGINETDYEEVTPFLTAMHHFLCVKDDIQVQRLEWLLGVPLYLEKNKYKADPREEPKLGILAINSIGEEIMTYKSTLENINSSNETILSLIWKSKKSSKNYTLFYIKELMTLIDEDEAIMKYMAQIPPPTYQYSRYTDWLIHFCEDWLIKKGDSNEMQKEVALTAQMLLEQYTAKLIDFENELKEADKKVSHLLIIIFRLLTYNPTQRK